MKTSLFSSINVFSKRQINKLLSTLLIIESTFSPKILSKKPVFLGHPTITISDMISFEVLAIPLAGLWSILAIVLIFTSEAEP
ncbi:hypothetical protein D3C87_1627570 [compost metagenome]